MRNKGLIIGVLIVFLLLVLAFLAYYFTNDWKEKYEYDGRHPYDARVFYNLVEDASGDLNIIDIEERDSVLLSDTDEGTYMFFNTTSYIDSLDANQILNFIDRGNQAFIVTEYVPYELRKILLKSKKYDEVLPTVLEHDTGVSLNLFHPEAKLDSSFEVQYGFENKFHEHSWSYLKNSNYQDYDYEIIPLGKLGQNRVNFIQVNYGKGKFFFHLTPLAFSNYALQHENGFEYMNNVLAHIELDNVLWDEVNKIYIHELRDKSISKVSQGPLSYMLKHKELRSALYLILFGVFLYLIFGAKRVQRIIPVIRKPTNTSLEFAETIGLLYYKKYDHRKLVDLMWNMFESHVRRVYGVTGDFFGDDLINEIAFKADYPADKLKEIWTFRIKLIEADGVSTKSLKVFNDVLNEFYGNAK